MASVIGMLQLQTITRQINKGNLQLELLSSQETAVSSVSTEVMRKRQRLYTILNEKDTTSPKEDYTQLVKEFDSIDEAYNLLCIKSNEIDIEKTTLNDRLAAYNKEREELVKMLEKATKNETPKLTLG